MAKDMPFVGVTLSPQVKPNTDWYARTILKSDELIPVSTAPNSLAYNITPRTYSFQTKRGRTYDLGRLEAGQCSLKVNNSDGLFDPANTSSPLYPNVEPYRPLRITAAYPRTGNILNDTNKGYSAQRTIQLVSAVGDGSKIVYTAVGQVPFHQGQIVSITGMGAANTSGAELFQVNVHAMTTTFQLFVSGFTGTVTAGGYASLVLPATLTDGAVSVCANDANFELGVNSNWYTLDASTFYIGTDPRTGTYSMGITPNSKVYLDVPCVAGQSVTFSIYAKADLNSRVSGTLYIYPDGYIDGTHGTPTTTSFSATTSYTRRTVTVTANAPKITVAIKATSSFGLDLTVDDIQVEFGSSASTFSTTGSTVYNLFNGFVERYPQSYQAPNRGEVEMMATDVVAMMSQNIMLNPYQSVVIQDDLNVYYFPLNESDANTATVTAAVGNGTTQTYTAFNTFQVGDWVIVSGLSSLNLAGTITSATRQTFSIAGSTVALVSNANGTAKVITAQNQNQTGNLAAIGHTNTTDSSIDFGDATSESLLGFNGESCAKFTATTSKSAYFQLDTSAFITSNAYTMDVWVNFSTAGTFLQIDYSNGVLTGKLVGNTLSATWTPTTGSAVTTTLNGVTYPLPNNTWELVRLIHDGTKISIGLVGKGFSTATTVTAATPNSFKFGSCNTSGFVGRMKGVRICDYVAGTADNVQNGTQVTSNLFLLGANGNYYDSTGVRAQSLMGTFSGFNYVPVSANQGAFTMQQINSAGRTLFDVMQATSQSEFGYWFIDGAGVVNFKDWWTREYPTTPVQTFGDGTGETPYNGADVTINYDLTYVYNQVEITRVNGGKFYSQDVAYIDKYFPRTLSIEVENADDNQIASAPNGFPMAEIYLERYKDPQMRPDHLVLTPMRNPASWNIVLGLEIGDYVKFVKRPIGGVPLTVYGWIENIEHSFDGQTSDWITTVVFSPAPAPL